jgi:hypothetical protein
MPVLLPPPPAAHVRSLWGPEEIAYGQGEAAELMKLNMAEVQKHWRDRAQQSEADEDDEEISYRHVPFEVIGTRKVRYTAIEPLRPRRIVWDDEDE